METSIELDNRARICIIGAALLALFLGAMDALVMSVAMPTIVADLGGLPLYAWVYSAFLLTSAVSLPVIGKLADLYKTKTLFNFSIGLFVLSSIAAGLSQSMPHLVIARAIQGIGAGGNMALVYIVLSDVAPTPEKRAKTLALASFIWGIASVVGPSVGGFVTTYFSWRWIFFINVPIGIVSMTGVGFLFVEMRTKKKNIHIDFVGVITLSGFILSGLTIILMGGREYAWDSFQILALMAITLIFGIGFYLAEQRAKDPIIDLRFFGRRGFAFGNGAVFLASFAIFSLFAYAPLFLQGALRRTPIEVGLVMLSLSFGWSCGPPVLSLFLHQIGNKLASATGALLIATGSVITLTFNTHTSMVTCFMAFLIIGIGMGFVSLCTLLEVQRSLEQKDLGVATSSNQFSRTLGGTIGVGISGGMATGGLMQYLRNSDPKIPTDLIDKISGNIENIFRPDFFNSLGQNTQTAVQNAVANSITAVFWLVLSVTLVSFAFTVLLPNRREKGSGV